MNQQDQTPAQHGKSTKLPDQDPLSDGKNPQFKDWLLRIKDKLKVNVDHYPTYDIQRAYIIGRTSGDIARFIAP